MFPKSALLTLAAILVLAGCQDGTTNATGTLPEITAQPRDTTISLGGDAVFSVTAIGATHYQWIRNATDTLAGAVSSTLTLTNLDSARNGSSYKCLVRNANGFVVSNTATLHVFIPGQPPVIGTQPASVAVLPGGTAVFHVTATGENLAYQWYRGEFLLSGATSATLTLPGMASLYDGTVYRCRVSNTAGQVFSETATLRVDALRILLIDTGETVFQTKCTGCHGISGRGSAGSTPPLANADYLLANRRKSIEIVLGGAEDSLLVNGLWYHATSPAWVDELSDVQVAGVLTYLRAVLNDSTVTSCNAGVLDGNGFATCVKTPRSPTAIAADSISIREVQTVRDSLFPL